MGDNHELLIEDNAAFKPPDLTRACWWEGNGRLALRNSSCMEMLRCAVRCAIAFRGTTKFQIGLELANASTKSKQSRRSPPPRVGAFPERQAGGKCPDPVALAAMLPGLGRLCARQKSALRRLDAGSARSKSRLCGGGGVSGSALSKSWHGGLGVAGSARSRSLHFGRTGMSGFALGKRKSGRRLGRGPLCA